MGDRFSRSPDSQPAPPPGEGTPSQDRGTRASRKKGHGRMRPETLAPAPPVDFAGAPHPPGGAAFVHLKPRDLLGWLFLTGCAAATGLALWLSTMPSWVAWLGGQILLAFALLQWFVLLHEAGHNTLFRTRRLNRYAGTLAGFFAL